MNCQPMSNNRPKYMSLKSFFKDFEGVDIMKNLWLVVLCVLLGGCSWLSSSHFDPDIPVRTGETVVLVHPLGDVGWETKVGVLPFQVPANVKPGQGIRVAALFKDILLGRQTFRTVRQLSPPFGNLEEAVSIGRRLGVEYVLAGRVDSILEGSEFGGARIAVSVRLLATDSGDTVWYLEQALEQEMDYPDVGLLDRVAAIVSTPPIRQSTGGRAVPNMLARVAMDMATVMASQRQSKL